MAAISISGLERFSIRRIKTLRKKNNLTINKNYQRSYIWKKYQKQELIESILANYPIGAFFLWKKGENKFELLDGQQRIQTIEKFIDGEGKITTEEGKKFDNIGVDKRTEFYAFKIPCLIFEQSLTGEQISDIFIRLQEGTRLSIGEKIYAFRGNFRNGFVDAFFSPLNEPFFENQSDWRFKARFLAGSLLALELKADFENDDFPTLKYVNFKDLRDEYKTKKIPKDALKRYNKNLQFMGKYLYGMLGRLSPQEIIPPYLLLSYFTQSKINEEYQGIVFKSFMLDFHYDVKRLKMVNPRKPKGMDSSVYERLYKYKVFTRKGITSESFSQRFKIIKEEYERRIGTIRLKDKQRFAAQDQKILLYFKQKGICPICKKDILYKDVEADHIQKHETGGKTEIDNMRLVHHNCHVQLHNKSK